MTKFTEIAQSLDKTDILLSQLESTIEERNKLITSLNLTPSSNDNYDLINLLNRAILSFNLIQNELLDIADNNGDIEDIILQFQQFISRYSQSLKCLEFDSDIDVNKYKFEATLPTESKEINKTVRFRDNLVEYDDETNNEQIISSFKPFKDDISEVSSFDNVTNQQLFAEHQQMLLDQDNHLDSLHNSIQIQHSMGLNINRELDDHLILLDDLEQGVESSQFNLNRATNRLNSFRKKVKENGNLTTIIVLVIILILLLVVLN